MITATVETLFGTTELYFNEMSEYKRWRALWQTYPKSDRIVHGWSRPVMFKSITRVISVEDDRVITKGRN